MVRTPQTKDKIQDAFGKKETTEEQGNERSSSPIKEPIKKDPPSEPLVTKSVEPTTKLIAAETVKPAERVKKVVFPLRIPQDMHQQMRRRAWKEDKSLHQYILDTLKKSG